MGKQVSSGETGPLQNGERAAILRAALLASLPCLSFPASAASQSGSRRAISTFRLGSAGLQLAKPKMRYWVNAGTEPPKTSPTRSAKIYSRHGQTGLRAFLFVADRRHVGINRASPRQFPATRPFPQVLQSQSAEPLPREESTTMWNLSFETL
jgi:hypothetical protein